MAIWLDCTSAELGVTYGGTGRPSGPATIWVDGISAVGSSMVLAPVFCKKAVTVSGPPQEATGPAWPVTRRSGSEYPSDV